MTPGTSSLGLGVSSIVVTAVTMSSSTTILEKLFTATILYRDDGCNVNRQGNGRNRKDKKERSQTRSLSRPALSQDAVPFLDQLSA